MRTIVIAALTLTIAAPVHAQVGAPPVVEAALGARSAFGERAPGGWSGYRDPAYGYRLPEYWRAPEFVISDYEGYDLRPPAYGFQWSRYYDDAVLTDQWGRVYDARRSLDWERRGPKSAAAAGRGDWRYDGSWQGTWRDGRYDGTWRGAIRKTH